MRREGWICQDKKKVKCKNEGGKKDNRSLCYLSSFQVIDFACEWHPKQSDSRLCILRLDISMLDLAKGSCKSLWRIDSTAFMPVCVGICLLRVKA